MKIELENITPDVNSSFRLLHNPRLSDLFYWHFHPEFELVYIEGANGTRHVGDHISPYYQSDLVLIGSNIPHLNFDYGVKTDYKKVVVHIQPRFVERVIDNSPELSSIAKLFHRAAYGIAFLGEEKDIIGQQLLSFEALDPFSQYIQLLKLLKELSLYHKFELLHENPFANRFKQKEQQRLRSIYGFIDQNYHHKIELSTVAGLCNLSKEAFCRYFKKTTGKTFIEFLNQYRVSQAKRLIMNGFNINEACYECGFESLSYFSRTFKRITSETPSSFRNKYADG